MESMKVLLCLLCSVLPVLAHELAFLSDTVSSRASREWVQVASCRAGCLQGLVTEDQPPLGEAECGAQARCYNCWTLCEDLVFAADAWSPFCMDPLMQPYCDPGCRLACDFKPTLQGHEPDSNDYIFPSEPKLTVASDDLLVLSWPEVVQTSGEPDSSSVVMYLIQWRQGGDGDGDGDGSWKKAAMTSGTTTEIGGKHQQYLQLQLEVVAVHGGGAVASAKFVYPPPGYTPTDPALDLFGNPIVPDELSVDYDDDDDVIYRAPVEPDYTTTTATPPVVTRSTTASTTTSGDTMVVVPQVYVRLVTMEAYLHAEITWSPTSPDDVMIRWGREDCKDSDASCNLPQEVAVVRPQRPGSQMSYWASRLRYNSRYWVELHLTEHSVLSRTSFETSYCPTLDVTQTKCLQELVYPAAPSGEHGTSQGISNDGGNMSATSVALVIGSVCFIIIALGVAAALIHRIWTSVKHGRTSNSYGGRQSSQVQLPHYRTQVQDILLDENQRCFLALPQGGTSDEGLVVVAPSRRGSMLTESTIGQLTTDGESVVSLTSEGPQTIFVPVARSHSQMLPVQSSLNSAGTLQSRGLLLHKHSHTTEPHAAQVSPETHPSSRRASLVSSSASFTYTASGRGSPAPSQLSDEESYA